MTISAFIFTGYAFQALYRKPKLMDSTEPVCTLSFFL